MKPTAAPAHWPYLDHRTMAEVIAREEMCRKGREANKKAWQRRLAQ